MFEEVINIQRFPPLLSLLPSINDSSVNKATSLFESIDIDMNGAITEDELDNYFRQYQPELRCFSKFIIQVCGINGYINDEQFYKLYESLTVNRDNDRFIGRYIFDYIDSDQNGFIESAEFANVIDLIKFPDLGMKSDAINRAQKMNYEEFSRFFYIVCKMGWRKILRRNTL